MGSTSVPRWWRSLLLLATLSLVSLTSANYGPRTIYVHYGGSIQDAINHAHSGDTIIVTKGTYKEQLLIKTDHLTLIGKDATIQAPDGPGGNNKCTGLAAGPPGTTGVITQAGICVLGQGVQLKRLVVEHRKIKSVKKYICGVSISGFKINGFSGIAIAIVGGQDTVVTNNQFFNNNQYGALTVGSKNTQISKNHVYADGGIRFIGICMDDKSDVHVTWNRIANYYIGLCVQTNGADVHDNDVSSACVGAYVDPDVVGARLRHNVVHDPPKDICFQFGGVGSFGIILAGADNTKVEGNIIKKLTFGIALIDDPSPPQKPTTFSDNNVVIGNILTGNGLDISDITKGTGNVITGNICKTPKNLCK